jgi:methionyl-tRNA synthetase
MARIFIGVAWPYANGPFHIGHLAGAYLPGDIFARFHRLKGDEVLMVSGSDMHGTPILVRAEEERSTPEVVARRFHETHVESFRRLGFTFDVYTNTHTVIHERTVQEVFLTLLSNGFISRRTEENAYCPQHQRFLPDRYLTGTCPHCGFEKARGDECDNCGRVIEPRQLKGPKCSLCGTPAEYRPSEHFYLQLDKLQRAIESYLADKDYWRANVLAVTRNFVQSGLRPTPITRDLDWGVPIPLEGYDTKRFYVWFEAVIGYLSASREWAVRSGRPDAWRKFWDPNQVVRQYYFIGKDNVFFHTITWPAILLGHREFQLPYDVPANEWLLIEGRKVSKSRPTDVDVFIPSLLGHYAPDVIRFHATYLAPQNHDIEFDWDEFHQVAEDVLSNQYGNLVQRSLVLTRERFDGRVPSPPEGWSAQQEDGVPARLREAHRRISREFEQVHLKEALDLALTEVREANRRFHEAQPWQSPEEERRTTLYETVWTLKAAAIWLSPVIPFSSAEVFRMLGYSHPPSPGDWDSALVPVEPGQPLGEVRPLFPRRETPTGTGTAAVPPAPAPPTEPGAKPADAPAIAPLVLRAALVAKVENHPSADRLYVLTLDLGEPSPTTVVAGVRPHYTPDELTGRRVILFSNLEPRTIRKVTSHGMVLAGEAGGRVALLSAPDSVAPGTPISGVDPAAPVVKFEAFERTPVLVGVVVGSVGPQRTTVDVGGRSVQVTGDWTVGTRVVVRLPSVDSQFAEVLSFGRDTPVLPDPSLPPGCRIR